MEIKIIRESGRPVAMSEALEYEAEFKTAFDDIKKRVGLKDHEVFEAELKKVDQELALKYDTITTEKLPKSGKQWRNLLDKYKSLVMISLHADTDEVFMIIKDLEF